MKERLDVLLVKQGYAPSREKAKAVIMSGNVFVDGGREDKAGAMFDGETAVITVKEKLLKYVSRGGLKLEKAMQEFPIRLEGAVCMDIGASTGGFTDCMLQNGAAKVFAVDVGHGQLAWSLRNDSRVVCMEKTNFRYVQPEQIGEKLDFASVDVAFISLSKILIPARNLLKEGGQMVCLIKPQFEAGREKVGKKGVVRDEKVHREVISKVVDLAFLVGFKVLGLTFSPVRGPEGNIEYLIWLEKPGQAGGNSPAENGVSAESGVPAENGIPAENGGFTENSSLTEHEAEQELRRITEEKTGPSCGQKWAARIAGLVEQAHSVLENAGV